MNYQYEFVAEKKINLVLLQLKRYGITIVPDYLKDKVLEELNQEFEKSLTENYPSIISQYKHPTNKDGKVASINPYHEKAQSDFPSMVSVFMDPFLRSISEEYFSPHPFKHIAEIFSTHELPCEVPILPWHHDRIQSLKYWFYLKDTCREDGAFQYCPGTHWEGHYRAGFFLLQGIPIEELPNDIDPDLIRNPVTLELKAGDLLIFDSDGFHSGGVVSKGRERRVLNGHTHPLNGRSYGDSKFSAGWWLKSRFNLARHLSASGSRIIGEKFMDQTINRSKHDITK